MTEILLSSPVRSLVDLWLSLDKNLKTRSEIESLAKEGDEDQLKSLLQGRISFGTAGLRGPMRAGFQCMNDLIVIQTTQGIARLLNSSGKPIAVAVGRDARHNSDSFARLTAATFVKAGIKVYYFKDTVATPIVAFTVRNFELSAGVMITASHNPKDDNGYKVYWEKGSQIVSPVDKQIHQSISENLTPWDIQFELDHLEEITEDPVDAITTRYFQDIAEKCSFRKQKNPSSSQKIVYTAMHGVGTHWCIKAFECFDLPPFIPVKEQIDPDPDFPTVAFPNPEEGKGALQLSINTSEECGAKIIIANDPDADRLAAAEKQDDGAWKIFTGNELGILFGDWVWQNYKKRYPDVDPGRCVVINTAVSSKMLKQLAEVEGLKYDETLTGFKWIGNLAQQRINEGYTYLYSFEDAIGFMIFDTCLDKDGVRAAAVFAEMANEYYENGSSLSRHLQQLYEKYGYFATQNRYFFCYDAIKMESIFNRIRNLENGSYPSSVGDFKIKNIRDLTTGYDNSQPENKAILPISSSTQMITFYFENGALVTLRGSGTEPKLKYYTELHGKDFGQTDQLLSQVKQAVIDELLQPAVNGLLAPAD